jgi:ParB family chromosome partitioning protein
LAESIRAEGLLQPIVVRRTGERFQLIAGERRWRAFQQLKIKAIPARVVEASNASAAAIGLIENLQREGLNPIEEAHGFASLIRDFDLTQENAAERVGKARASVANTLRLLALDAEIQGYLAKNLISVGHAKVLLGVEDTSSRTLLSRRIIEEGLSVRATEKIAGVARAAGPAAPGARPLRPAAAAKDAAAVAGIEKKLTSHLGARVAIIHTPKKGRIVIEYRGNEDLQRLLEKFGVEA